MSRTRLSRGLIHLIGLILLLSLAGPATARNGDYNGDGQPDILWQNTTTGDCAVWLMNGTSYSAGVALVNLGTQWSMRN